MLIMRHRLRLGQDPSYRNRSIIYISIPGVPKKSGTADFQYLASQKYDIFFTSLVKASSAEEIDSKIIEFG